MSALRVVSYLNQFFGQIGGGRMGLAMAKPLLRRGYVLTVCDVDASKAHKSADLIFINY